MYTLYKCSVPGFEKEFKNIEDLKDELELNICTACFNEECKILHHETYEVIAVIPADPTNIDGINREYYDTLSTQQKIVELLGTACGCEFDVCDKTVTEISSENR